MDAAVISGLVGAAFIAGAIDAMVGGGGLIQLPALFAALPEARPATLLATSKLAGFLGTGSAAARFLAHVRLPWRTVLPALMIAFPAALAGAITVSRVDAQALRPFVPLLLTAVLIYTLAHRQLGAHHAPRDLDRRGRWTGVAVVAAIGFYDGFFGPGTGSLLMLLYVRHYGFDFVHAAAAARLVNVVTNAAALAWFTARGQVLWPIGLAMAVANTSGAQLGTRLAIRRGAGFVRVVFAIVASLLILKTGWDALHPPVLR